MFLLLLEHFLANGMDSNYSMEKTILLLVWWTVYLLFHVLHFIYHQMSKSINEQLENEEGPWLISISDVNMLFKVEPRMHFIWNGFRLCIELKVCVFLFAKVIPHSWTRQVMRSKFLKKDFMLHSNLVILRDLW